MAPSKDDKKPEPGDLIEIFRGTYQHWVIYVGEGYVIHLAPPSEHAQAGAYSMMSVLCDKATVKKDELYEVVGNDEYRINNLLDDKYEPRAIRDILRDAHNFLGQERPYCVFSGNCEHFVTELRYGKPQSRQLTSEYYIHDYRAVLWCEKRWSLVLELVSLQQLLSEFLLLLQLFLVQKTKRSRQSKDCRSKKYTCGGLSYLKSM